MTRGIRAVSRKRRIVSNADIFISGDGSGFGFRASVGQEPAGKSAGKAAGNISASRSRGRNGGAQVTGCARSCFFDFGLRLVRFLFYDRRNGRGLRLATILGKRFAGKKNGLFRGSAGCGSFWRAMVKATLRGTARFESTRCAAAIFRASLAAVVLATVVVTTRIVSARLATLRRSIFRRRQIASAGPLRAPTAAALASATASPTSAATTVATAIATTVTATIS